MTEILLGVVVLCLLAVIGLQIALVLRKVSVDLWPLQHTLEGIDKSYERAVRDEIAKNRGEASAAARQSREELSNALKAVADTLAKRFDALTQATSETLKGFNESLVNNIGEMAKLQKSQLDVFSERLDKLTQTNEQKLDKMRETVEQRLGALQEENAKKLAEMRQEAADGSQKTREEVTVVLKAFNESVGKTINDFLDWQRRQFGGVTEQLKGLTEANEKRLTEVRTTVEERLKTIQEDNAKNLEQMRQTVDEKLQGTLEKRLGESFKLVSERLEQVYKGLGEMQTLAVGVGDLKRVLTNVKSRGTWGEVQLEGMLEQVLCPDQYDKNVATKDDAERVEFAIKLPGRGENKDEIVWLPIDAKFPIEDYQRLQDAQEKGDPELAETAAKHLENRIKMCACDISDKYLNPPKTTDFGILFLPTEGLFAEVVRRPRPARTDPARIQGGHRWPHHALVDTQQPANGLPNPGDPAAIERGLEPAGGGQDGVWQVRRCPDQGAEEVAGGHQHDRHGGRADQSHRAEAAGRAGIPRPGCPKRVDAGECGSGDDRAE